MYRKAIPLITSAMPKLGATSIMALAFFIVGFMAEATTRASGLAGNALSFNGTSDTVEIPDSSSLHLSATATIQIWIDPEYSATLERLVEKGDGADVTSNRAYEVDLSPSNDPMHVGFSFFSGQVTGWTECDSISTVPANQWTEVTGVYDSINGYTALYLNGVLDYYRTTDASGNYPINQPIYPSNYPLYLGSWDAGVNYSNGDGLYYGGLMDEVRIWNTALSAAEIAANYDQLVDPTTPGLVADYEFDEAPSDQSVDDATGYGNNGSLGTSLAVGADDPMRVGSTAPIVPVPEPSSIALLLAVAPLLVRRRSSRFACK